MRMTAALFFWSRVREGVSKNLQISTTSGPFWVYGSLARIKRFANHECMNISLSLDDKLVKEIRRIAAERGTTLTSLVRACLEELAAQQARSGRKHHEREALERTFGQFQFHVGKRTWRREDLH